jgi:hypothetical protein
MRSSSRAVLLHLMPVHMPAVHAADRQGGGGNGIDK